MPHSPIALIPTILFLSSARFLLTHPPRYLYPPVPHFNIHFPQPSPFPYPTTGRVPCCPYMSHTPTLPVALATPFRSPPQTCPNLSSKLHSISSCTPSDDHPAPTTTHKYPAASPATTSGPQPLTPFPVISIGYDAQLARNLRKRPWPSRHQPLAVREHRVYVIQLQQLLNQRLSSGESLVVNLDGSGRGRSWQG